MSPQVDDDPVVLPDDPHGFTYEGVSEGGSGWTSAPFATAALMLKALKDEAREVTGYRRDGRTIGEDELAYMAEHGA